MAIEKHMLERFRVDFAKAVEELETKYNCKIKMKNISFAEQHFTSKIEVVMSNDKGVIESKEAIDYKNCCYSFDLKLEWLNKKFLYNGMFHEVIGLKPHASKRPVLVKCEDGGQYLFSHIEVIQCFAVTELRQVSIDRIAK